MLNFQKLSIFCLLIASLGLVRCMMPLDQFVEENFEHFASAVKRVLLGPEVTTNYTVPDYVTIRYESIDQFNKVSHEIKEACLRELSSLMGVKFPKLDIKVPNEEVDVLAYKAADKVIRKSVKELKDMIFSKIFLLRWQFDSMLYDGNILEFLIFREQCQKDKAKKMKNELELLKEKFEDMSTDEAELLYILHHFDWGTIGDDYPVENPEQQSSESGLNSSGRYQTIEKRFHHFVKLVKKVADNGALPNGTHKYNHIDDLHEVEHDFKLRCLFYFETELHHLKSINTPDIKTNTPNYAYSALDRACKYFVFYIIQTLTRTKIPDNDIERHLDSMITHGNIIKFLVHKKNGMTKEQIQKEVELLKDRYREMEDEEAEIWAILYKYDKGIFGDRYPTLKQGGSKLPKNFESGVPSKH